MTHDNGAVLSLSTIRSGAYDKLIDGLCEPAMLLRADGAALLTNEAFRVQTGRDEPTLLGFAWLSLLHGRDGAASPGYWARLLQDIDPFTMDLEVRRHDGKYTACEVVAAPLAAHGLWLLLFQGLAVDVPAQGAANAVGLEALRASEHRFSIVFRANPLPTAITRLSDGRFLDVNDAFLRMTGLMREEVIGLSPAELGGWADALRERSLSALDDATQTTVCEVPYARRDGCLLVLRASSERIVLDGEPCVLIVCEDITERRAAEAALRRSEEAARGKAEELSALMEAVPATVWVANDPECREVTGSRLGYELLGMAFGQNMSKSAYNPAPTAHFRVFRDGVELAPHELPLQVAARTGREVRDFEEEVRFDDGRVVHLYGSAIPLRDADGKPRGAIAAFVDVTRIKKAEEVLRESGRRKDEFLALLSHELRNPLAPILTAIELMKLRGDVPAPKEREVIERQAHHLVRLVDDLLDVSRVARGKIELKKQKIEMGRVIAKSVEATTPLFEKRQHTLRLSVPSQGLMVEGDEVRLTQVISNLLTNAAKYTPAGGRVSVTADVEGDDVVVVVSDNGIGIAPDLLPQVFDMFVQGPRGPDRAEGGLGLGLALVKSLTALHGGRVEVHSAGPGKGSEFVLRLPLVAAHRRGRSSGNLQPAVVLSTPEDKRRILVIDDNEDAAEMLLMVLEAAGHDVRVANDPPSALALLETFAPELAIVDIGLPVMDGYELAREMRARLGERTPMLIALSGYGQEEDKRKSLESGFVAHMVKPVNVAGLIELIKGQRRR